MLNDFKVPRNRNDYKLQLLIELYRGMRMGEINALRTEDIDLENGLVHVRATIYRGLEYRNFIKDGAKTDAGVRDIPVNKALAVVLKNWLGHRDIHMILDIYADVFDSMHHSAMEKFEGHILKLAE